MKTNKKGFTLVELLASLVILGLLTAIAAPNIIGIVESSRNNTYIEDAKKLATLAEYRLRSDSNVKRPANTKSIVMSMDYLGTSEFKNSPYQSKKGEYMHGEDTMYSFVVIKNNGGKYEYYVQLIEKYPSGKKDSAGNDIYSYRGIKAQPVKGINSSSIINYNSLSQLSKVNSTTMTVTTKGGAINNITDRYVS